MRKKINEEIERRKARKEKKRNCNNIDKMEFRIIQIIANAL